MFARAPGSRSVRANSWGAEESELETGHISYGATDHSLSDRRLYPHVFRTVQNHHVHNMVITKLVKHFGWTWVGILVSDNDAGENELQILTKYMREDGICAAYIIKLTEENKKDNERISHLLQSPQVSVIIICGTYTDNGALLLVNYESIFINKTLILPPSWALSYLVSEMQYPGTNGSLAVDFSSQPFPGEKDFVKNYRKLPNILNTEAMLKEIDFIAVSEDENAFISFNFTNDWDNKTYIYAIPSLRNYLSSGVSPRVYNAVEILGKSLHEMFLYIKDKYQENSIPGLLQYTRRLQRYLQRMKSPLDPMASSYYFNDQGEAVHPYKIINWVFINKTTHMDIRKVEIGNYTPWDVSGQKLYLDPKSITWKHTIQVPVSSCSDPCLPGSRKKPGETIHTCCYDCVLCSEEEISSIADSDTCIKCPSDEWPNEKRDRCLPKVQDFISYHNDTMASVFSCVSLFGCLVTGSILRIFISYRDTPIVRANNRNLSYLLLVSIILSFLSVFLFLGRPSDVTCRLRETSFGVFFSVAVSSLLAKTVMVCVAFKSTKPGSPWRKWLSVKLPYTVVLLCSSIQVVICVIWLSTSPPFQDLDTQSYPGKIIIQCNAGSDIWFYSMLGYLGFLAAVSFVLAFMVRTLPDNFNEAKYITFSMLVFCSVWIAMIPAYLSTTGKSMVAVEVFAVMASSAGLAAISNSFLAFSLSLSNRSSRFVPMPKHSSSRNQDVIRSGEQSEELEEELVDEDEVTDPSCVDKPSEDSAIEREASSATGPVLALSVPRPGPRHERFPPYTHPFNSSMLHKVSSKVSKRSVQLSLQQTFKRKSKYTATHPNAQALNVHIGKLLSLKMLPYRLVETEAFRNLMAVAAPRYFIVSGLIFGKFHACLI
ncbi:vomeronasal type-2 receptor 26-like [Dendropsophus ebraccatus]|uniref:vomeronasal type-2 receptor 26-like n=1 Tax=Dendropsophus ebraccatus TaxID=150705 RepID=UPI0038313030